MSELASWRRSTFVCAAILFAAAIGCFFIAGNSVTLHLAQAQDAPVLLLLVLSVAVFAWRSPAWRLPLRLPPSWIMLLGALAVAGALWFGAYAVFDNYPVARDEHMVVFDMAVYAHGYLAMPLAPFWQPYAGALVPDFLLNERRPAGLVSAYLPMNALLRLGFSKIADPALMNPLLAVFGGVALLDIARRTFPDDARTIWVVMLIYGLSAQMLVGAMTLFSVTAHMALNLIWLAAFLRGGRAGHAVAIATGFVAVGLHQLAFHPVFVAPFLLWRLREGQWRLVLIYAAAYALIVLCWAGYPLLPPVQTAVATAAAAGETHRNFVDRVLQLLLNRTPGTIGLMVLNLLRFAAWQNFALIPLLVVGIPLAVRQRGFARALVAGILLWLAMVTFILPYQGLGWGYRYLSPYLGSFALLAGLGYRDLVQRMGERADGMVIALSASTLVAALPILLVTSHEFARPYRELDRLIAQQPTPFVIVDTDVDDPTDGGWALHPLDQVRNLPDLSNRPLRFSGNRLNAQMITALCDRGDVTVVTRRDMHGIGFAMNVPEHSPWFENLISRSAQQRPACLRPAVTDQPRLAGGRT